MEDLLKKYVVTTPELYFGDVAGMLTKLGAILDSAENNDGVLTIGARAPEENMSGFEEWLAKITNGNGECSENA